MKEMAAAYPDEKILQNALAHLPWEHNQALIEKLDSQAQRVWYARKAVEYGWSHNILKIHIERNRIAQETEIDHLSHVPDVFLNISRIEYLYGLSLTQINP